MADHTNKMTLEEAIIHCREKSIGDCPCADDHRQLAEWLEQLQAYQKKDVVEVVRCKDCKHRPTGENKDDLEFPDEICPCQCEDYWYSWKPSDNWFCGNGERKNGDHETD